MATTDPLELLFGTMQKLGAPQIRTQPAQANQAPLRQQQPQRAQPTARQPLDVPGLTNEALQTIQTLGAVRPPAQIVQPGISEGEQRLRELTAQRSATQQVRQRQFDERLSGLLDQAANPGRTGDDFIRAREARRLSIALLQSGGLTGFDTLSQSRDVDLLNRQQADRGQDILTQTANVEALQRAREETARNVSGGATTLLQQRIASQIAGESGVQQAEIAAGSGENRLAGLVADVGQGLTVTKDIPERQRLVETLAALQGIAPTGQQLVSDVQGEPIGSFSPTTGGIRLFPTTDPAAVQAEADARTRSQVPSGGAQTAAAGTGVSTRGANTQQLVAKVLAGEQLTDQERRQFQTSLALSR